MAVSSRSLSAMGSMMAPNSERWLKRRAIQPSSPSLAAAITNAVSADQRSHSTGALSATLWP